MKKRQIQWRKYKDFFVVPNERAWQCSMPGQVIKVMIQSWFVAIYLSVLIVIDICCRFWFVLP